MVPFMEHFQQQKVRSQHHTLIVFFTDLSYCSHIKCSVSLLAKEVCFVSRCLLNLLGRIAAFDSLAISHAGFHRTF